MYVADNDSHNTPC